MSEERLVELMIAYQAGDATAFQQLYGALAEETRRFFLRTHRDPNAARDLVQDLFLELHRSRRSYSPPLPVRPWIYGIARHVSARTRRSIQPYDAADLSPSSAATPAEDLDLQNAVTALPVSTREPWLMHHVAGLSFASIAAHLGITVTAAKLRASRATRALRLVLSEPGSRR